MSQAFRVTYDPQADMAYLYLIGSIGPGEVAHSVNVTPDNINLPDVTLDFDAEGRLIGIELFSHKSLHPVLAAQAVPPWHRPRK